jgi:hypothetical protein
MEVRSSIDWRCKEAAEVNHLVAMKVRCQRRRPSVSGSGGRRREATSILMREK